jgi:hypothetical protein
MLLLQAVQAALALLQLFHQLAQALHQVLMSEGQGIMAPNDGHHQGICPILQVICIHRQVKKQTYLLYCTSQPTLSFYVYLLEATIQSNSFLDLGIVSIKTIN